MADQKQTFKWVGINRDGNRVSGMVKGNSITDAQNELKRKEIEIIDLHVSRSLNLQFGKQKVGTKDILTFTHYLSTMIAAGLPIIQALDILSRDEDNIKMHDFIVSVKSNVSAGKTLSESFVKFPEYFSNLYCSLIRTGEKSGALDKILNRLGTYLEKTEALKRKIKKAMIYPIAIVTVAIVVSLILLLFVVPKFQQIFSSFGAKLPLFTRIVIEFSNFLQSYWWVILGAGIGLGFWLKNRLKHSSEARKRKDYILLKIPVLGGIFKKAIIARYTRTLAITLEAGMPITDALKSMQDIVGNRIYGDAIQKVYSDVVNGNQLSVSMAKTNLFPNMAIQMISVGEASGSLGAMLNRIADYYEDDVNNIVDNLSSLLEPLIMAVLGVIIGGFVIAMYLPIFKLGGLF